MRYAVSGSNTSAVNPATASDAEYVLGKAIKTGRHFWLRGVSIVPNATYGPVHIVDAAVGATATAAVVSIGLNPDSNENVVVQFSAPGLKFTTGCVAFLNASGSIGIGQISGWGYEEGAA